MKCTINRVWDFFSWWTWRRWRIYCPKGDVSHLFKPLGFGLFDYDEAFVSPCTLNEIWCGGFIGKWTPRIRFMSMDVEEK